MGKQACVYIQHVWVNMHESNETTSSQMYLKFLLFKNACNWHASLYPGAQNMSTSLLIFKLIDFQTPILQTHYSTVN